MTRHDVILLCDDSRNLFGNPLTLTNDDMLLCCSFRRIVLASEPSDAVYQSRNDRLRLIMLQEIKGDWNVE